ncbi:MAG TPA: S8 family serine peptidase [Nevskiaceae bacterium]|nr:S8 family serine peptidase [Nevskiaceae bacterium]
MRSRWIALATSILTACASAPVSITPPAAITQMQTQPDRLIVVAVANPTDSAAPRAGSTLRGYDAVPRYAVSGEARATLADLMRAYDLREVAAWPIVPLSLHCAVLEVAPRASRDEVIQRLTHDPRVRVAQPLQTFSTLSDAAPTHGYNDPYVSLQRGFAAIQAQAAQQWSRGEGVRVAIVDTGLDTAHPDLKGRVRVQRNFVDADAQRFGADRHGTAVAGVIAAVANNREGIVGVAPEAELLAFKACWQPDPRADAAQCNSFTLAQAISAAIESTAQIVNLSLAGPADPLLTALVMRGLEQGMIFVGAVPRDGSTLGFPAGIPGVIAVDAAGALRDAEGVLRAPGREILTLTPGGHYDFASGSSLAAAHVSGTVALLLRESPHLSAVAMRDLLRRSSLPDASGQATVNACAALLNLGTSGTCAPAGAVTVPAATFAPLQMRR